MPQGNGFTPAQQRILTDFAVGKLTLEPNGSYMFPVQQKRAVSALVARKLFVRVGPIHKEHSAVKITQLGRDVALGISQSVF